MKRYGFGVDIGGTSIKFGLFDELSQLVKKWEIATRSDEGGNAVCERVATEIKAKLSDYNITEKDLLGVGIAVPAPVDKNGIIVLQGANLRWEDPNIKSLLESYLNIPIYVMKDSNAALLGEIRHGRSECCLNAVLLTIGTGLGCSIVINGGIVYGSFGCAGELGHVTVNKNENEPCGCGKFGCLEQYASASGIVRIAKRMIVQSPVQTVLNRETMTAKEIFKAYAVGDELAVRAVREFVSYLGSAIGYLTAIIDPELIIIGGGVSLAGDLLLDLIRMECEASFGTEKCELSIASLGNDAGIFGAFSEVIKNSEINAI